MCAGTWVSYPLGRDTIHCISRFITFHHISVCWKKNEILLLWVKLCHSYFQAWKRYWQGGRGGGLAKYILLCSVCCCMTITTTFYCCVLLVSGMTMSVWVWTLVYILYKSWRKHIRGLSFSRYASSVSGQRHQGTLAPVFPSKSVQYVSDSASSSPQSSACDAENGPEENPPALIPPHGEADDVCDSGRCRRSGSGGRGHPTSDVAEQRAERRMNRNGFERNGMTGSNVTTTSENLAWLASVGHATQATRTTQAVPHHRPPGGALLTTVAAAGGHHDPRFQHPAAVGAGVGLEALYRSGLAVTDPSSRLFIGGQYSPAYTTTPTTLSPYPQSLYSTHGGQPMSPYAAYMYQWPAAAYSPGAGPLMPGQYPHIESFSAVLQNLGSQHAQHSHLPRPPSFVRPHVPHAPYPGSLTTTTDSLRAPAIVHRSAVRMAVPAAMEPPRKSPKRDQKSGFRSDPAAQHSPHDRKSPRRYSPVSSSPYRHPHHLPTTRDATYRDADPRHTDPSAARKHRILTQSPQATADPASVATYSPHHGVGPTVSQRSRSTAAVPTTASVGQPPPLLPSHSSSTLLPQSTSSSSRLPPLPSLHPADPTLPYPPHPHYPPHFMRGSVIQLANGQLKRVEELRTDDFISSADVSADLKIDSSTVVRIEENAARGTAILGFSVGNQRIQVGGASEIPNVLTYCDLVPMVLLEHWATSSLHLSRSLAIVVFLKCTAPCLLPIFLFPYSGTQYNDLSRPVSAFLITSSFVMPRSALSEFWCFCCTITNTSFGLISVKLCAVFCWQALCDELLGYFHVEILHFSRCVL